MRRSAWLGGLVVSISMLLLAEPAPAVITVLTPLKAVLSGEQFIFVAKVSAVDPAKPAMILKVEEHLKGKAPFERLPVNLSGDEEGKKEKHPAQLLKRVEQDLPVIVFCSKRGGKKYTAFGYTNGTWFQLAGYIDENDPTLVRWAFLHCEPYFRRTYKGTTAELRQAISDGLSGKKEPPAANENEPPGLGPELKKALPPKGKGAWPRPGPVFGVIPTVAIGGPLAILAALFPSLFGKPKEIFGRYLALLTVISINSIAYLGNLALLTWWPATVKGHWWASQQALWGFMAVVTLLGTVWAWRRYNASLASAAPEELVPKRGEVIVFQVLSVLGLMVVSYAFGTGKLFDPTEGWRETLAMWPVIWAGTLLAVQLRRTADLDPKAKPRLPLEGVMLATLTLASLAMSAADQSTSPTPTPLAITNPELLRDELSPKRGAIVAFYQAKDPGTIDSSVLVAEDCLYVAVAHRSGLSSWGQLLCLDRKTRSERWAFDDGGEMKQIFSSPWLADGRLYIGEGYHQDNFCKMFCIDARTGKKLWDFSTKSHTESSPCVLDGKLYFGAGDDGVYCLDAKAGKPVWHYPEMHVDTSLAVVGGRVYGGGGGYGKATDMFCLNAADGRPLWKTPSRLPVFGSPTVYGSQVFFGTGNGNMVQDDKNPAGALFCLKADTGAIQWKFDVPNGIHTKPAVDRRHVYFGSRDQHVYCISRTHGKEIWQESMGSPLVTAPALLTGDHGESYALYLAGSAGRICCLDPLTGKHLWQPVDVPGQKVQLLSSPRVHVSRHANEERRQLFFGAGLFDGVTWQAGLFSLEDRSPLPGSGTPSVVRTSHDTSSQPAAGQ